MSWNCADCGKSLAGHGFKRTRKYCDRECMDRNVGARVSGTGNPNYRGLQDKTCLKCGTAFHSYNKARVYCSQGCYHASRPVVVKPPKVIKPKPEPRPKVPRKRAARPKKPPRQKPPQVMRACERCQTAFRVYPSTKRRFCTYKCHLDSGGGFRAGLASVRARMKYGPKKDANHNELLAEITKHCPVYDLSKHGSGLPDGIAWVDGAWRLFDVKNPKTGYGRRGLNPTQKKWLGQCDGGPVYLIYSVEEASRFARGEFDLIKFVDGKMARASVDEALGLVHESKLSMNHGLSGFVDKE